MKRSFFAYVAILLVFGWGIAEIIHAGKRLESGGATLTMVNPPAVSAIVVGAPASAPGILKTLRDNLHEPLSQLLVQLILIVLLARVFGAMAMRMGQPAVI